MPEFDVVLPVITDVEVVPESTTLDFDVVPEDILAVDVTVGAPGIVGPRGPQGIPGPQGPASMQIMTQAQYDALAVKDPAIVYVVT